MIRLKDWVLYWKSQAGEQWSHLSKNSNKKIAIKTGIWGNCAFYIRTGSGHWGLLKGDHPFKNQPHPSHWVGDSNRGPRGGCEAEKVIFLLLSPSSYCLPYDRLINWEMSCWAKEQWLYSESRQMEKMIDSSQRTILPGLEFRLLSYEKRRAWSQTFPGSCLPLEGMC